MNIVVIINDGAGSVESESARETIHAAFRKAGADVRIVEAAGADLGTVAAEEARTGASVVVAAGGDGTLNAVASALVHGNVPMGVLPMGTLNHFAKDAGIPLALEEAAALIVHGTPRHVDVGQVNGRYFLNNSSIGLYPLMVKHRDEQIVSTHRNKWTAMLYASLSMLKRFPTYLVRITTQGRMMVSRTPFVFIGNNRYTLNLAGMGTRQALADGLLSVFTVRSNTRMQVLSLIWHALRSRLAEAEIFDVQHVEHMELETKRRWLDVSLDGEVVQLPTPLSYHIHKRCLLVVLP